MGWIPSETPKMWYLAACLAATFRDSLAIFTSAINCLRYSEACWTLSSKDKEEESKADVVVRAGKRLAEMEQIGLVIHGVTGIPVTPTKDESSGEGLTNYWDGGIADMFPTFDKETVIVA